MRVLIVDDSQDTANSQAMVLEAWGHEARAAFSAESAFSVAAEWNPDAILIDIAMPDEDGISLAQRLRDLPESNRMLLVAISGYTDVGIREMASKYFDHYLFKPVDLDALKARLKSEVASTRFRANSAPATPTGGSGETILSVFVLRGPSSLAEDH